MSTLCDPIDCSLPGSSVLGIFQAKILEQVAISSSRGSSQFRGGTCISCFPHWQVDSLPLSHLGRLYTQYLALNFLKIQDTLKRKKSHVKVSQSCPTLCNPLDYTAHGILQARILEWVAFLFSRGSSQPKAWTQVSCITGGFFTSWATREALNCFI